MNCNKCGTVISDSAVECERCGELIQRARTYDYKTVETDSRSSSEVMDYHEALGWELAGSNEGITGRIALTFRRNRKIKNKEQLNRIQVRLDDAVEGIRVLEKSKTKSALMAAIAIGTAGSLTFGGGLSICILLPLMSNLVSYVVGCFLGVVGFGVCGLGYLAYVKLRAKNTAKINVLIDKKRDGIADLCEEAQRILSQE